MVSAHLLEGAVFEVMRRQKCSSAARLHMCCSACYELQVLCITSGTVFMTLCTVSTGRTPYQSLTSELVDLRHDVLYSITVCGWWPNAWAPKSKWKYHCQHDDSLADILVGGINVLARQCTASLADLFQTKSVYGVLQMAASVLAGVLYPKLSCCSLCGFV
jgi:hypothetical protein